MIVFKCLMRLGVIVPILLLGACAYYKPLKPTPIADIPDGPGLLTGEDGEWVLYRKQ